MSTLTLNPSTPVARTYTVSVSRGRTTLLPHQMEALASEFCGLAEPGKTEEEADYYIVTFSVKGNMEMFKAAVSGFAPVPPNTQ